MEEAFEYHTRWRSERRHAYMTEAQVWPMPNLDAAIAEYEDTYDGRRLDYASPHAALAHIWDSQLRHHRGKRRRAPVRRLEKAARSSNRFANSWMRALVDPSEIFHEDALTD